MLASPGEVNAELKTQLIELTIWAFAGDVLVFVVWRKHKPLSNRERAATVDCGVTPFAVLALVKKFNACIGRKGIGVKRECSFDVPQVAVSPKE